MLFTYMGHVTAEQWNIPPAFNAAGPARNTVELRYCTLLKQRSSQMSCLVLKFLMHGIVPCYSMVEQILLYNSIMRHSTVGSGSEMGGRGSCALPSTDHSVRTEKLLCAFCRAPFLLGLFYTCAKGLFEFCTGPTFWFDNSPSWNNLSREQLFLPCWKHSVPTRPYPVIGRKGQLISQAHSLFIDL